MYIADKMCNLSRAKASKVDEVEAIYTLTSSFTARLLEGGWISSRTCICVI